MITPSSGYSYGIKKTLNASSWWRCRQYAKFKCSATMTTKDQVIVKMTGVHCHPPLPLKADAVLVPAGQDPISVVVSESPAAVDLVQAAIEETQIQETAVVETTPAVESPLADVETKKKDKERKKPAPAEPTPLQKKYSRQVVVNRGRKSK